MKYTRFFNLAIYIGLTLVFKNDLIAQHLPKEMSKEIDISLENGWTKILQMKNGNTLLFNSLKKGMEVLVFDDKRTQIARTTIKGNYCTPEQISDMRVRGVYEIAGEPVIFLTHSAHRREELYRLRLNAVTGELIDETKVLETSDWYHALVGVKTELDGKGTIFIEKDAESDAYCVVAVDAPKNSAKEKIRVIHFDSHHKPVSDARIGSPVESYKFYNIMAVTVDADRRLFIAVYGAESDNGRNGHIHLCRLNHGDTVFQSTQLDFSWDFKNAHCLLAYNRGNNTIQLLANTAVQYKPGFNGPARVIYTSSISYLDSETMKVAKIVPLTGEKIDSYLSNTLKLEKTYSGLPIKMVINNDNTTTILHEERASEMASGAAGGVHVSTMLDDIGITELSDNGVEKDGYVIRKYQYTNSAVQSASQGMLVTFDHVFSSRGKYIIINDTRKNFEKNDDEKRDGVSNGTKALNTICYSLAEGKIEKFYLFGPPGEVAESKACLIPTSHYNKASETYAVLVRDGTEQKNTIKVVWVNFRK